MEQSEDSGPYSEEDKLRIEGDLRNEAQELMHGPVLRGLNLAGRLGNQGYGPMATKIASATSLLAAGAAALTTMPGRGDLAIVLAIVQLGLEAADPAAVRAAADKAGTIATTEDMYALASAVLNIINPPTPEVTT